MSTLAIIALALWLLRSVVAGIVEPTSMEEVGERLKHRSPFVVLLNLAVSVTFLALAIWAVVA